MDEGFESPVYEHTPGKGRALWLDGAWSWPRAKDLAVVFHPAYEVGIIMAGEEWIFFEGEREFVCRPGDVWLCRAWELMGWQVSDCGVRTVVPHFLPGFLGDADIGIGPWHSVFEVPPSLRPRVHDTRMREHFRAIGEHMSTESLEKRASWEHLVRLDIIHLLTELARDWEPPDATDESTSKRMDRLVPDLPDRLMPALVLARAAEDHKVSIAQAAEACGLSKSRFQAEFHQAAGMTFGRYCLRTRLRMAAHLLAASSLSVKEVAVKSGFWDDSHFHRHFHREYNQSPTEYRHAQHR